SGLSAVIGLAIARGALATVMSYLDGTREIADFPFWVELGLSPSTVLYTVALALLAGVIVGVVPALKATRRDVQAGLQQLSARGSRMQLGRTWTALIVAQVAIAVAGLPYAGYIAGQSLKRGSAAPTFPIHEIIRAQVAVQQVDQTPDVSPSAYDSAMRALLLRRVDELKRRLEAEPGVAGVTFASRFPGEEQYAYVEAEGAAAEESFGVRMSRTDPGLLDLMGVRLVAGRPLAVTDLPPDVADAASDASRPEARSAIVNGALADRLRASGGGAVLGRHIRLVRRIREEDGPGRVEKGPWVEVVGVMPDFMTQEDFDPADAKLYLPASLAHVAEGQRSVSLAVRVRGTGAAAFAPRFRRVAAAVDPGIELHDLRTAADLQYEAQQALWLTGLAVAATTLSVLLLSAAGIYAMMSFTVARRRREIGIRAALGANARHVLGGIFARAGAQVAAGVLVGVVLAAAINQAAGGGLPLFLVPLAAGLMLVVGLLAALGPARRGLAVQPTEALREE
ncbi:MAG TPA: FtsX-like permease family protein, partial [Gemmatimonadaceae bacterium]|nr:FtsX-like permease family protein [Gemmatimonadaceae bacterium]